MPSQPVTTWSASTATKSGWPSSARVCGSSARRPMDSKTLNQPPESPEMVARACVAHLDMALGLRPRSASMAMKSGWPSSARVCGSSARRPMNSGPNRPPGGPPPRPPAGRSLAAFASSSPLFSCSLAGSTSRPAHVWRGLIDARCSLSDAFDSARFDGHASRWTRFSPQTQALHGVCLASRQQPGRMPWLLQAG